MASEARAEQIVVIVTRFGGVFTVGRTERNVYVGGYQMTITEARRLAETVSAACAAAEVYAVTGRPCCGHCDHGDGPDAHDPGDPVAHDGPCPRCQAAGHG